LNIDGSLDNTFNTGSGSNNPINTLGVQTDGKIVIGGSFTAYNATTINRIARLNIDGTLDNTFNTGSGSNITINSLAIQTDGKIIIGGPPAIGGQLSSYNGTTIYGIARLNIDGTLDNTYNYVPIFRSINIIHNVTIQVDGKIIVGGSSRAIDGVRRAILRLNNNGSIDTTFNIGTGVSYSARTTLIQPDSKILIGGTFLSYNNADCSGIVRVNNDGSTDNTFNNQNIQGDIVCLAMQNDGKIIVGGGFYYINNGNINKYGIVRLNSDGTLDNSFNISGTGLSDNATVYNGVYCLAIQNDGKIIIGGIFTSYDGIGRNRIARINGDSTLDTSLIEKNSMVIYPNPVTNMLQIQTPNNVIISSSRILDISGKLIFEQKTNSNSINTEILTKGFYILEVFSGKDKFTCKFIKE
jgi:uncharacterized delta-60 repeat protein